MMFKSYTLEIQRHMEVKMKENTWHVNTKHKKAGVAIFLPQKEDLPEIKWVIS